MSLPRPPSHPNQSHLHTIHNYRRLPSRGMTPTRKNACLDVFLPLPLGILLGRGLAYPACLWSHPCSFSHASVSYLSSQNAVKTRNLLPCPWRLCISWRQRAGAGTAQRQVDNHCAMVAKQRALQKTDKQKSWLNVGCARVRPERLVLHSSGYTARTHAKRDALSGPKQSASRKAAFERKGQRPYPCSSARRYPSRPVPRCGGQPVHDCCSAQPLAASVRSACLSLQQLCVVGTARTCSAYIVHGHA
ncbi:hypothetical protein IWX90DRAFT_276197 [Phyllosticta citrichinensis]|uniref:Uncharacterized protein n=1 Tax=Phyllosticta citrichinensis TaxID=1130410 RepID=A0ABR1XNB9_9PEZI